MAARRLAASGICLGAHLARLEARIALEAILGRFEPAAVERGPSLLTRGPRVLRVRVG